MQALLEEYEVCKKFDETACCLRSLDAPHYHHELTKRALLAAFEKPDQAPALLQLLQRLTDTGVVSQVLRSPPFHMPPLSDSQPTSMSHGPPRSCHPHLCLMLWEP